MAESSLPTPASAVSERHVSLISVSIDLGAGRRGVDMGPSAIRIAGLDTAIAACGIDLREVGTVWAPGPESVREGDRTTRYLDAIVDVALQSREMADSALEGGGMPLILGGDHSLSLGTVPGVSAFHARRGESIGLIWVDAHTDMNTPKTSPSGNVHGMVLAALTGQIEGGLGGLCADGPAVDPERVSILGARDIDAAERDVVRASGVRVFTMSELDERGVARCMDEALERATADSAGFHLSFDLDALDPTVAPGVGTPVDGGLTYREAHLICEKAARTGALVSLEVVELNPVMDTGNDTARLAVGMIESALGRRIL